MLHGSIDWPGAARAVVQQAGGFPDAALGGALEVEQKGAGGMAGFQGLQGVRRGVDDDRQLVIQVMSGGGGHGAGAIGVSQSFHTWMLAGEEARFGRAGPKLSRSEEHTSELQS